jgi:hypothetical protein
MLISMPTGVSKYFGEIQAMSLSLVDIRAQAPGVAGSSRERVAPGALNLLLPMAAATDEFVRIRLMG